MIYAVSDAEFPCSVGIRRWTKHAAFLITEWIENVMVNQDVFGKM